MPLSFVQLKLLQPLIVMLIPYKTPLIGISICFCKVSDALYRTGEDCMTACATPHSSTQKVVAMGKAQLSDNSCGRPGLL